MDSIRSFQTHFILEETTNHGNPLIHRARKRFGQHFLCDPNIIEKIVDCIAPNKAQAMVEIGPGLGAITCPLLKRLDCLEVVELDRDLIPRLISLCVDRGKLVIHNEDALRFDFTRLAPESGGLRIIGNLPYNISTPLLFHLLKFSSLIVDMHFLLQKEVVERITAVPGTGDYGRLSVMVQSLARAERLFNVGPGCFSPPPKVNSAFIRLTPHQQPLFSIDDRGQFSQVVTQAFSKRRKTLRNALKELLSAAEISAENIDPGARAETLSIEQFAALSNRLSP